jgi:PilZ domain
MRDIGRQYHRRSRRVTIGQPVKLRPSGPRGESFEEICTTKNVSREGFYFFTKREHYHEGMRLLATLPYHAPDDLCNREYIAQVVRVDLLDGGQRGVAVQLLSSLTTTPPSRLPGSSPP